MVEFTEVNGIPDIIGVIHAVDCLNRYILSHIRRADSLPTSADRDGSLLKSLCMRDEASTYIFDDFGHIPFSLKISNKQFIPVAKVDLDEAEGTVYLALEEYRHPTVDIDGRFIYTLPFIYAEAISLGQNRYRMIGVSIRVFVFPSNVETVSSEIVLGYYDFSRRSAEVIEGVSILEKGVMSRTNLGLPIYRCSFHEVSCLSSIELNIVDVFQAITKIGITPTEL